ncbi:MAG TPA: branched-chain amino acid ABC transporter permease [Anaerolineales bacterium]|jgi:branched-chain amino acid transport system permease protein|nr:branched-chain amino acid ABC transporter permease [Anaerolineales bacterium]
MQSVEAQTGYFPGFLRQLFSAAGLTLLATITVAIATFVIAGPFVLVNAIVTGGMWALMAAGLSLVFGVMNIVNFAHGEFFMVGTLVAYFVFTPLSEYLKANPSPLLAAVAPFAGILAALVVGAVLGVVIEKLVFLQLRKRTKEQWIMNSFLLTVGLSVILINGVQIVWGPDFKGITRYWDVPPIDVFGVTVSVDRAVVFILAMVTMGLFWFFLRRTRTGRAIRAVSQDETGALMMGIDMNRIQVLTLALSSALAALAGASLLFMFPSYPTVGLKPLYIAWYVVILVGMGNVAGALVGGFIVALLQTMTSYFIGPGWEDVIPTAFVMLILLVRPSGLFGSEVKGIHER